MSVLNSALAYRRAVLGSGPVAKATGTLSAATFPLYTIAGGEVLITSFYLKVTTTIAANGGTLALQSNPTTGDTAIIVAATDLGTSDAAAGTLIGVRELAIADASVVPYAFSEIGTVLTGLPVPVGQIELVGASAVDGAVTAYITWVPLTDGATLVAA